MTSAEARFNKSSRPRKPEGSLGRTAQDGHLDSHTAPELCSPSFFLLSLFFSFSRFSTSPFCLVFCRSVPFLFLLFPFLPFVSHSSVFSCLLPFSLFSPPSFSFSSLCQSQFCFRDLQIFARYVNTIFAMYTSYLFIVISKCFQWFCCSCKFITINSGSIILCLYIVYPV